MATTTKSKTTSAKSKTTKKPVKKAATKVIKKSAPAKKTVAKKAPAKAAPKASVKSAAASAPKAKRSLKIKLPKMAKELTTKTLRQWHIVSALVFTLIAVFTLVRSNASSYSVTLSHVTKDDLVSGSQSAFAPAAHLLVNVDMRFMLAAILLVSALLSVLRITRLRVREERGLEARVLPLRWIDFGITYAALVGVVAQLAGAQDLAAIKLAGLTIVGSYFFAWLAEREGDDKKKSGKLFGITGMLLGLVPWLFIIASLVATDVYGNVRLDGYVYAAAAVLLLGQLVIGKLQKSAMDGTKPNYLRVEKKYLATNLAVKTLFAVIVIAGIGLK